MAEPIITEPELHAMVRMLQALTPLERLSNMEARVVFDLLLQRGYVISPPAATQIYPSLPGTKYGDPL